MELKDLTPEVIGSALEGFYQVMSKHFSLIAKELGNESMSVPRVPRQMGTHRFAYFFAAELDQLFRFALGGLAAQRSFVLKLCDTIERLLFSTPHGQRVAPDAGWYQTPLGFAVAASRARCNLRKEDGEITREEIALMSTLTTAEWQALGLEGDGPYPSEKVRPLFDKNHIPV